MEKEFKTKKEILEGIVTDLETFESVWNDNFNQEMHEDAGKIIEKVCNLIGKSKIINDNHYKVYGELVECMESAAKDGEIAELSFQGVNIRFDAISIDDNGSGDDVITLYRDGLSNENFEREVARLLLKGDSEYIVEESSGKGLYPELIEKQ